MAYASATMTLYACVSGTWTQVNLPAGSPGPAGDAGPPGPAGDAGPRGPAGAPGTLLSIQPEGPGSNCAAGGQRIDVGSDANGNGVLDPGEVQNTQYVCNGATGPQGPAGPAGANGASALVAGIAEPPGTNCANGGVKLLSGADGNRNGSLDDGEVTEHIVRVQRRSRIPGSRRDQRLVQPGVVHARAGGRQLRERGREVEPRARPRRRWRARRRRDHGDVLCVQRRGGNDLPGRQQLRSRAGRERDLRVERRRQRRGRCIVRDRAFRYRRGQSSLRDDLFRDQSRGRPGANPRARRERGVRRVGHARERGRPAGRSRSDDLAS